MAASSSTTSTWVRARSALSIFLGGVRCGRVDPEDGAAARAGVDVGPAVVTLHDPERHRKTEPGAPRLLLGGVEGLEDALAVLGRHPHAAVAHLEHHVAAGRRHVEAG